MGINTQYPLIYFVISLSLTHSFIHLKSATFSKNVQNVTSKVRSATDRGKKYVIHKKEIGYYIIIIYRHNADIDSWYRI